MSDWNNVTLRLMVFVGVAATAADLRAAVPDQPVAAASVTAARKCVERSSTLVENLQNDIVEELTGEKEKMLFRVADQAQNEFDLLDKALVAKNPTRETLYKQFDRTDTKVSALVKVISELNPKRPSLAREAERVRVQNDDLHYVLSAGDETKERQRQVLARQARSMASTAKQFASAADYAIRDRAPFTDAAKKFVERCASYEKSAADSDLDKCKKDFSTLTDAWGDVVQGFRLLAPREDYHIARLGFRVDQYHSRLFELLKMPGKRPVLMVKL